MVNYNNNNNLDLERAVAVLALDHKVIDPAQAAKIIHNSRKADGKEILSQLAELFPEKLLLNSVAKEIGISFYDLFSTGLDLRIEDRVLDKVDLNTLKRLSALPMVDKQGRVVVVVANPTDRTTADYLDARLGSSYALALASRLQIQNRLSSIASATRAAAEVISSDATSSRGLAPNRSFQRAGNVSTSSTATWVNETLERAVSDNASDVHFMHNVDGTLIVRFRVDGLLAQQPVPTSLNPQEIIGSIISKCITMDPTNRTAPQDGTFSFVGAGRNIDARVASLPQAAGLTLVIRLLDSNNMRTRLDDMGFTAGQLKTIRSAVEASGGTILVCGPTGSGKSTTLYGLLREVDSVVKSVFTVENPVEYRLPFIGQTEIRDNLGENSLTFAKAVRTILRLDPDIILVGEIRDKETAEVAMQAANSGHLVLSTVHSNSSIGAYSRLIAMGVPRYLVSETVTLVIAQRLVRRVHDCMRIDAPTLEEVNILRSAGLEVPETVAHTVGCGGCKGTGFRGRLAVVEVLQPDRDFRTIVNEGGTNDELYDAAVKNDFSKLAVDGLRQVREHKTTVEEMLRVLIMDGN